MHEFQVGKETHIFLKNGDEIWGELIVMDAIGVTMKKKKGQCFDSEGDRVNTYCTSDVDFCYIPMTSIVLITQPV